VAAPAGGALSDALLAGTGVLARALALPLAAAAALALGVGCCRRAGWSRWGRSSPISAGSRRGRGSSGSFRRGGALQVGKGLLKVTLVGVLAWATVRPVLGGVAALAGVSAARTLAVLGVLASRLALRVALVALALGVADYLFAYRRHLRGLMMTRDEVKRESKESEGDPSHRAERQRLHRELMEQRMVAEVREADFVVVNPDHIAVALRYDRDGDAAPVVVASGERLLAERIKQVARESGVPIFRDVTLARSLCGLPEGEEIPAALYEAVAEVLRVVYGMGAPESAAPAAPESPPPAVPRGAARKRV